jgi:hypothetical protein
MLSKAEIDNYMVIFIVGLSYFITQHQQQDYQPILTINGGYGGPIATTWSATIIGGLSILYARSDVRFVSFIATHNNIRLISEILRIKTIAGNPEDFVSNHEMTTHSQFPCNKDHTIPVLINIATNVLIIF